MKLKAMLCTAISALLLTASLPRTEVIGSAANTSMREMTTMEIVTDMGIGINLGNTFESCGDWIDKWGDGTPNAYETAWGSPTITQKMIQGYADEGFGVLRIPVAWSNMMTDDGTYTIDPAYLARVTQVVDWALDADLYVIMNLHWDGGWLEKLPTDYDNCMRKYTTIWTQLSDAFRVYGDHLMFEAQNEELSWSSVWNQWGGTSGKEEAYGYANAVNQAFVDTVRASGGNNAKRHLLISGYNTDITLTCDPLFQMPDDPAGRCALSVHYYTPAGFALLEKDESWAKLMTTWGTDTDYQELNKYMDMIDAKYASQGIPVIIGEYGCPRKNKEEESVRRFLSSVCEAALSRGGICPVLWDTTGLHYNRTTCKMTDSKLQEQFAELKETYLPGNTFLPPVLDPGDVNGDGVVDAGDAADILVEAALNGTGNGKFNDVQRTAADVNLDGEVDASDAAVILMYAAAIGAGNKNAALTDFI